MAGVVGSRKRVVIVRFISVGVGGKVVIIMGIRNSKWGICAITFGEVDEGIRVVFGKGALGGNEGHIFIKGNGFDARNGGIGNWKDPRPSVDAMTGGKRHEIVIPTGVTGGIGGNGTKGTRFGVIGCTVVNLDIGPKFKGHCTVV